jgi:transcriptional regulator GlxA family with amidase domain
MPVALVGLALTLTERQCWISDYKDPRIVKAIALIASNYPAAVPNKKLSLVAGMNTNAFIRTFKRVTSRTPRQHLQALRLKEASFLLHHSTLSIEEIAERTGFNDRQDLNIIFRKQFRITPAQFRKNFLKS